MTSRILLADDSITIQKVVNLTFADEGIEVIAVSNGEVAERRLSEINPDLVLADIFMPGKNGYELCEFVKQSPQFSNVPVVLLVGAFEPFNEAEARRVRADAHLTKPFESRTLVETVRKLIGKSGRAGAAASQSGSLLSKAPIADVQPAFNLDLAGGISPEWSPAAQSPPVDGNPFGAVPNTAPLADPSPLDLDYGSFSRGDSVPSGFPMQPEHSGSDTGFSFISSVKDTAELPPIAGAEDSTPADNIWSQEPVEFQGQTSASHIAAPAAASEVSFSSPFDSANETPGFKVQSTFSGQPPSIDLDFEKVDAPAPSAPENVVSFDVDFSTFSTSEASTPSSEPAPAAADPEPAAAPDLPLEVASSENEGWATQDYSISQEPDAGFAEQPQAQSLALDDPLGDVLSTDNSQPVAAGFEFVPQEPVQVDELSAAPLRNPWESAIHEAHSPLDADTSEPMSFPDPFSTDRASSVVHSGLSFEAFSPVAEEASWADPSEVLESAPVEASPEKAEKADTEEPFTSSEMWSSEVPQFAAIDIEAVTVEEAQGTGDYGDAPDAGSGFAFASVGEPLAAEPTPMPPPEPAVESASDDTYEVDSDDAGGALSLPQSVIDEIVRRVVAQIGDAVVREIAWEVVPDCVERVVEKLTHEGATKRM